VVEKLHQFYQCQLGTLTVHVVHLPTKCFTQGVTTKVVDLQTVLLFQILKNAIDPLDAESGTFLTNQNRRFDAYGVDMGKTVLDVLL
jgi:hypothetical protein